MLRFVGRRALVQWPVVAGVVALVAVAATLLGVCALLLGSTQDRAFSAEVQRSPAADVDVTAYLVDLAAADLPSAREQAERVVADVLAPTRPTLASTATSRMRTLADGDDGSALGYLAAGDDLEQRATLSAGQWPAAGSLEAAVPEPAAARLGLAIGDAVSLGTETGLGAVRTPVEVVVVGTFVPAAQADWSGDPLSGQGFEPAYSDGSVTAAAYGPFVVADDALVATGSHLSSLRVTAHPTLSLADRPALTRAVGALDDASALLGARVDDQVRITRVASELGRTLERIDAQQATSRAGVVTVVLLGTALALAALLLAGRLVAALRDDERALLVAFGLSPRQQVTAAALEALLVALAAAALALPAAALLHARLTHLPDLAAAGLTQAPAVTPGLVATVLGGALLLTLTLVLTAIDSSTTTSSVRRRWLGARAGADVVLVLAAAGLAVLGWWQLRSQPPTTATRGDVTLTLAPVVCLAAATVVAVRVVPLLLRVAARGAGRARALVVPLAVQQAARRPHTGTAMVLVAAAVAAATFGLGLRATWERSQDDQAALRVGTDLALSLPVAATPQDASAVAAIGREQGTAVSAVVDRPLALGRYVGAAGSPPVLVAVDGRRAAELLRGRAGPTSWGAVGSALTPHDAVEGLALTGDGLTIRAEVPDGAPPITVTATAVVQDAAGLRRPVLARPVAVDGRDHPLRWLGDLGAGPGTDTDTGTQLVALRLALDGGSSDQEQPPVELSVVVDVPGPTPSNAANVLSESADGSTLASLDGDGAAWNAHPLGRDDPLTGPAVELAPSAAGTELRTTAQLDVSYLSYTGADLLLSAFAAPDDVPVAVSQDLVDAIGTKVGGELAAVVGDTALPLRVVAVVPTVPSAPGRVAVLADTDTISRALIDAGRLDPVVDGWWVADPSPRTVEALRDLGVGEVTTRREVATELAAGPLRVTVPTVLLTLVAAAVVLLLAGVALVLLGDQRRRSGEVARLRALGLPRRGARRLLLAEHGVLLVPVLLVGALVGAAATYALAPHLVRSDLGAAPVPEAVADWPWAGEFLLLGGVLVGCAVLALLVTARQVRAAGPAGLRGGEW